MDLLFTSLGFIPASMRLTSSMTTHP